MKQQSKKYIFILAILFAIVTGQKAKAAPPQILPYQACATANDTAVSGAVSSKFAICDSTDTTLWSNDDSSISCDEPSNAINTNANDGCYNYRLGNTDDGMTAIPATVFSDNTLSTKLCVWFNDGSNGFQALSPCISLSSIAYAHEAQVAEELEGNVSAEAISNDGNLVRLASDVTFSSKKTFTGDRRQTCPSNFTLLSANSNTLGCIQDDEDGNNTWEGAAQACFSTYGGRLASVNELILAFNNLILSNEDSNDEWTADYVGKGASFDQFASAEDATIHGIQDENATIAYRCFIPR